MEKLHMWIIIFCLLILDACDTNVATQVYPTQISPAAGLGGIIGKFQDNVLWQEKQLYVYAAPFFGNADDQGIYVLDPSLHPKTKLEFDGMFQLNNLQPGAYVLVIGTRPEDARVIAKNGKPWVIRVSSGQVVDLGTVSAGP